ncbi:hypothetical protein D3C80_1711730 [compost metagenome]
MLQGQAGVDKILDEQDMLAADIRVDILLDGDDPRGGGAAAVAGYRHIVNGDREGNLPHQVGHEYGCAFQNADQDKLFPFIIA